MAKFSLSIDTIQKISAKKQEPMWMLELRLKALAHFQKTDLPDFYKYSDNTKTIRNKKCQTIRK